MTKVQKITLILAMISVVSLLAAMAGYKMGKDMAERENRIEASR